MLMSDHLTSESGGERRVTIRGIVLCGMVLIVGIAVATTLMIGSFRERALLGSTHELENTVLLLSRHFDQQLEDYVDAQARLAARLAVSEIAIPDEFKDRMSTFAIHTLLEAEVDGASGSNEIRLYGADGDTVNTSESGAISTVSIADLNYFKSFKSNSTSAILAEPVRSNATSRWTISLARKIVNSDGIFLGVLTRRIDPSEFENFFESIALRSSVTVAMVHRDGRLLARFPKVEAPEKEAHATADLLHLLSTSDHGTLQVSDAKDDVAVLASARQMRNFPIALVATMTTSAAQADWREQTRLLIVVAGLSASVIIAVFLLIGHLWSREQKRAEQRLALGKQQLDTALATELANRLAEQLQAQKKLEDQKAELIAATGALSEARDAAEAASRAKSDFLAMMSHEIRTPMAGMMGMIDLLSGTSLNEEQQDLARVAQESAQNLLAVLNNILDFSKLEAGQVNPESIDFSIKHSIKSVISLLGPRAAGRGLRLNAILAPDLPIWLRGDPSRIGQVLLNLVGNAIKFTEHGSVQISVSHRVLQDSAFELRFDVVDTGCGIPTNMLSTLFSPFTQADGSVSRKYGSTGLGLAICKQLCLTMGGDIGVESASGHGSRFWFTVRCQLGRPPEVTAPLLQPALAPDAADLDILIVEDNPIIRSLVFKLLARRGYEADQVNNGKEALEAVRAKRYGLVLMDMQMPEMDGLSATKAIRNLRGPERNVPIVALTANALVGQRETCLAAGMNSFLTKPIKPEALYDAISCWAGPRHQADTEREPTSG
jgi:signal transduction histidine kinase/ActR/RegA family two-component response regulator